MTGHAVGMEVTEDAVVTRTTDRHIVEKEEAADTVIALEVALQAATVSR